MSKLSDAALKVAISQLGQHEQPLGSNWGKPIRDYLASVNIDFPASWCAAFLYWCFDQAADQLNTINPLVQTGGVLNHWNKAPKENKLLSTAEPKPGDIFIMDMGKGLGHTGLVEKVDDNFIYTIDGNTNDSGSREGIEVCRKQRPRNKIKGYLRY